MHKAGPSWEVQPKCIDLLLSWALMENPSRPVHGKKHHRAICLSATLPVPVWFSQNKVEGPTPSDTHWHINTAGAPPSPNWVFQGSRSSPVVTGKKDEAIQSGPQRTMTLTGKGTENEQECTLQMRPAWDCSKKGFQVMLEELRFFSHKQWRAMEDLSRKVTFSFLHERWLWQQGS